MLRQHRCGTKCLPQNLPRQNSDDADLFGNVDEILRKNKPQRWMAPPREDLEAHQLHGAQINHRLKARDDRIALYGVAHFGQIDEHGPMIPMESLLLVARTGYGIKPLRYPYHPADLLLWCALCPVSARPQPMSERLYGASFAF